jgi:hypothetical protein
MRKFLLAALIGCGSSSPEEELNKLEGRVDTPCGILEMACVSQTDATVVIDCMNQALQSGTVGSTQWSELDAKGFATSTYVFTDGHRIREFLSLPDDTGGPATLSELPSCTGPFHASAMPLCFTIPGIAWDGCP